jgi:hypothetical protein
MACEKATRMGVLMFIIVLIGFAGYILPVPSLIWAWVRWLKTQPRFSDWRKISIFSGLVLASLVGFLVLVVLVGEMFPAAESLEQIGEGAKAEVLPRLRTSRRPPRHQENDLQSARSVDIQYPDRGHP